MSDEQNKSRVRTVCPFALGECRNGVDDREDGQERALEYEPVPEPAALLLDDALCLRAATKQLAQPLSDRLFTTTRRVDLEHDVVETVTAHVNLR